MAQINGHDTYVCLKEVLERLPTQPVSSIRELPPYRAAPAS